MRAARYGGPPTPSGAPQGHERLSSARGHQTLDLSRPALLVLALAPAASAEPILDTLGTTLPRYQGAPAAPQQLAYTKAPRNPFMAPNPRSNIHNDTWMTDAYRGPGPLGNSPVAFSNAMSPALCGSLTFHSRGFIVSVCPSLVAAPQVRVIDPQSLELLTTYTCRTRPTLRARRRTRTSPVAAISSSTGATASGAPRRRATCSCFRSHPTGEASRMTHDYDLTSALEPDERISSALPDFRGRIWFVSKKNGKVAILNTKTRRIRAIRLGEDIQNSFTVDRARHLRCVERAHVPLPLAERQAAGRSGRPPTATPAS